MLRGVNGDDDNNDNEASGGTERTEVVSYEEAAARRSKKLGRYTLERIIAEGGMAEIWLATSDGPGGFAKKVVVKRIKPEIVRTAIRQGGTDGANVAMEMFVREARLLASLEHGNIVQVFEFGVQPARRAGEPPEHFIVMEVLEGVSLRDLALRLWEAKRPLPIEAVVRIVADACRGLEHAHRLTDERGQPANLVHRDISPDNIFVTTAGVTKLLDFGIAKREDWSNLTVAGELKGKVPYMAPEQLKGLRLDGRTDLFAVGVVLYWLLAGRRPFDGPNDVFTMKAILDDDPTPLRTLNPRVPKLVADVVMSCLAKEPEARISSAAALHDALSMVLLSARGPPPNISDLVQGAMPLATPSWEITPDIAASPVQSWSTTARVDRRAPSFDADSVEPSTELAPDIGRRVADLVANPPPRSAGSREKPAAPTQRLPLVADDDPATALVLSVDDLPTAPPDSHAFDGRHLPLTGDDFATELVLAGPTVDLDLPKPALVDATIVDMPLPTARPSTSPTSQRPTPPTPTTPTRPARRRRRRWQRLVPPLLAGGASAVVVLLGLSWALGLLTPTPPTPVVAVDAGVAVVAPAVVAPAVVVDAGVVDAGVVGIAAVDAGVADVDVDVDVDVAPAPRSTPRKRPKTPKAKAMANGFVLVKAKPWAKVSIDGIAEGTTPMPALPVSVGRHRVRLEHEKVVKTRVIDVVANKTTTIQIDMREP